ncbi:MAG: glutamate dehydrogenase/leucine dehydrogenase, partial [Planctomycetota bacterium]
AFGGIRRMEYRTEEEALFDCLRLSRAMSRKCLLADLPAGGAKMVLLDREDVDWALAYQAVGRAVERLGGSFYTGPDMGTGAEDLAHVATETSFVTDPGPEGPGLLGEATAEGVFASIGAALEHMDGAADWPKRKIAIQGLGAVGFELARCLVNEGAHVLASDIDPAKTERGAKELGLEIQAPNRGLEVECDVFAPCALGGILHDLSVERLACRAVVGGANNLLASALHGERLHERGILYIPDFVANAGALIRGTLFHLEGERITPKEIGERIACTVAQVLEETRASGHSPARVAVDLADARLAAQRENSPST